jgi:hypothetical protein
MTTREPFVSGLPGEPPREPTLEEVLARFERAVRDRRKARRHYEIRRVEGTKEADEAA